MSLHRGLDGAEPARPEPVGRLSDVEEQRRVARSSLLAAGTLACPRCDAPVALGAGRLSPAARLACPYCDHRAPLRDFLSLAEPTRPTRVEVHVVASDHRSSRRA